MADPNPPALTGVLETALYVAELERSVRFYREVLGFEPIDGDERLAALAIRPGQVLLLCARQASAGLGATAHHGEGRLHVAFAVPREALPAWQERLAAHDVAIVETRSWPQGGRSLYFRDPDGHLVELATPGVWSVY